MKQSWHNREIAARARNAMADNELSIGELIERVRAKFPGGFVPLHEGGVRQLLDGKRQWSWHELRLISAGLGVDIDWLHKGDEK